VRFPDFLRLTVLYHRVLARPGGSGRLSLRAGADIVLLTFRLRGTLSPTTVGTETKEDFLSQELPVPVLGLEYRTPVARYLGLVTAVTAGYLPRVPSLRHEGGEVRLRQDEEEVDAGLDWRPGGGRIRVRGVAFWRGFGQDERSAEDGNRIRITAAGLRLTAGVSW
jgi:hypothetical protein